MFEFAEKVEDDTGGIIIGSVTELTSDSREEVIYALYLSVPELNNYSYRLIEVTQLNAITPYPVTIKLFGKDSGNIVEIKDVVEKEFKNKMIKLIKSPITKGILDQLKFHVEIKKEHE
jgi:hypothetical protein